ncbi:tissue factor-like isoform X1 [Syngnathoides biaculeatus]|uniref:tissue factor-like isoform X1 n=1 Tax=Syngnathoides biaculeatus TaxID=300417 RepID=UPI002ADD5513|nr:tissue factor-like isoform X1 [Syngnathoides biaculeatus]
MVSLKKILYFGVCMSAWMITVADYDAPKAENVHWVSLDFKTLLRWTARPSNYTFTVQYSWDDSDWMKSPNCIQISETECDLSSELEALQRAFIADIQTEPADSTDYELDELPHTHSPRFNPYKQRVLEEIQAVIGQEVYPQPDLVASQLQDTQRQTTVAQMTDIKTIHGEISAAEFTVEVVEEGRVSVNIKDPLTSFHKYGKQLTIRDILKHDLQYKISYYKSGNTGKRDIRFNSNRGEVSGLDAGQSYCFMVAAFIPSRSKLYQQGAWSIQQCTPGQKNVFQELSIGALVGGLFILVIVLIVIITVTVLCCRRRNRTSQMSQSNTVI